MVVISRSPKLITRSRVRGEHSRSRFTPCSTSSSSASSKLQPGQDQRLAAGRAQVANHRPRGGRAVSSTAGARISAAGRLPCRADQQVGGSSHGGEHRHAARLQPLAGDLHGALQPLAVRERTAAEFHYSAAHRRPVPREGNHSGGESLAAQAARGELGLHSSSVAAPLAVPRRVAPRAAKHRRCRRCALRARLGPMAATESLLTQRLLEQIEATVTATLPRAAAARAAASGTGRRIPSCRSSRRRDATCWNAAASAGGRCCWR